MKTGRPNKKIAVILGTRPEIIKMSPIIRRLERLGKDYFIIHTGQHYSYTLDGQFFKELQLPKPRYRLNIHSKGVTSQADHTGRMLIEIEKILLKEMPRYVLVQGDTNTVLAGALTVSKLDTTKKYTHIDIRLGHVEAGLRSYDRTMPEEINRFITDHFSNVLFAPTREAAKLLLKEGIPAARVHMTGNTIVDAVYENLKLTKRSDVLKKLGLVKNDYFLLTLHRQENVDDCERLTSLFEGIGRVAARHKKRIIFPIHPRTVAKLNAFKLSPPKGVELIEPVGFLDFLKLEASARLILSDSGGVQEEACILGVPCVTLRLSTERPETVSVGANVIAGYKPQDILKAAERMLNVKKGWKNPFGDGKSAQKIIRILEHARP